VTAIFSKTLNSRDDVCEVQMSRYLQTGVRRMSAVIAGAGVTYATLAAVTWCCYGRVKRRGDRSESQGLDVFLPEYEVVERHRISVSAPAETTFAAASALRLEDSAIVRALFRTREFLLGSSPGPKTPPLGLVEQAKLWGWGVLREEPEREIIFGAVTQPWLAQPVFRALLPAEFAAFHEPGFARIAWTISVRPAGASRSIASTETRVATTDAASRTMFRRYWALAKPGIVLIRWALLRLVKQTAEARARKAITDVVEGRPMATEARERSLT
jgi:hypothetical protein